MKLKGREYRLRRNAEKRMAILKASFPDRDFWIAPTQSFNYAVYTRRKAPVDDPNAIGAICAYAICA